MITRMSNLAPGSSVEFERHLARFFSFFICMPLLNAQIQTTVALTSSPNPSAFGQAVTLIASLAPAQATGRVAFYEGVTVLGFATVSNSSASLTTILPSSGARSLTARFIGSGVYSSSVSPAVTQTVSPTAAAGLSPPVPYATASAINQHLAVADFNGDGHLDIVTNNYTILLGNGDGTFRPGATYTSSSNSYKVVTGDFNGDGKEDFATARLDGYVGVWLGNADGTFAQPVLVPTGTGPRDIAAGDFNSDGITDLAIVSRQGQTLGVGILLGNGDGTFQPIKTYLSGQSEIALAIADFNGDGKADIIAIDRDDIFNNISVLLGAGDGTFQLAAAYDAKFPQVVAVGDFNRDGKPDLAVATFDYNYITVYLGAGDGTFTQESTPPLTPSADPLEEQLAVGDLDGDGNPDIVWSGGSNTGISVFMGVGDGTFRSAVNFPAGASSGSAIAADFNGDGRTDLAVTNSSALEILLATTGSFPVVTTTNLPGALGGVSYSTTLSAAGGTTPYSWSFSASSLPWLSLSSTGVISGRPPTNVSANTYPLSVVVSGANGTGYYSGQGLSLKVASAFQINTMRTADIGKVGLPYNAPLLASGGTPPYSNWTVISGSLPPGLSLDPSSGVISGTPAAAGTFGSTITVNDSTGLTSLPANVSIEVFAALSLVTTSVPNGFTGVPYYVVLQGAGGFPPYNWTVVSGALPPGLTLDPNTGTISGTPTTTAGSPFSFTITFSDGTTVSPPQTFTMAISPPVSGAITLTTSANPSALGQPLTLTATVPGGSGSVTFYDGTTVLGIATINSGQAVFTTSLLRGGTHALKARYFSPPAAASVTEVISATADASLLLPVNYVVPNQTGLQNSSIIVADFNGDGKADIAAGTANGNISLVVRLGNGDGTFGAPLLQSVPPGTTVNSVVAGDFNEDGKVDLAIPNGFGLSLYMGKGDGTFTSGTYLSLAGGLSGYVVTGDFNGDGHQDLLLTNSTTQGIIWLGVGNGTFRPALSVALGFSPVAIAVGDFNGDGNPDLAVAQPSQGTLFNPAPGHINILLGNGDGTFQAPASLNIPATGNFPDPWSITVSDLNRDGNADLAISGAVANTVEVMLGRGDGTFGAVASYAITGCCDVLAAGDFNGDGIPDLLVPGQAPSSMTFLFGNGDGSFRAGSSYGTGASQEGYFPAVGDFNGDGLPDIALNIARGGANVVLGSTLAAGNLVALSPSSVTVSVAPFANPPSRTVTLSYQTATPGSYTFSNTSTINYTWVAASPASGPMTLASSSGGLYTYTGTVSLTFNSTFVLPGSLSTGTLYFSVNGAPGALPVTLIGSPVTTNITGVVNAAAEAQGTPSVVSTGSYIAIHGSALAGSANPSAPSLPLPTTLNGAQVTLGGVNMPLLYAASGQINALVPQGLSPNNSYPLVVMGANGTITALLSLLVEELQPAIYSVDSSGSGPGVVANNSTGQLITTANPAHVSDYLVVYCTGLGPLTGPNGEPEPADGAAAPANLLFHTRAAVSAAIGGVSAPVLFSGLTPTLAGLYQVNVQVPAGVAAGAAVPVVITASDPQTGASGQSNTVSIAVQ